ncbi:hypothetical protein AAHA92_07205 [Salvia divinorum]|uniref:Uncharacterized protein n=1 Tax=Salvia divinorum TaxID=28513 RepID=A0ABD1I869_SALDI
MKRVAVIEDNEDTNLAKEIAALRVRMDKIDNTKKKESVPPTLVINLAQKDASPTIGDVNYVQNSGGPNRTYSNSGLIRRVDLM